MAPSLQSIFSTPSSAIGRVEKATSGLLLGPDRIMNLDICNSINSDPWKAKSFVKAVKTRLQNKNSKVQFLALTLLESMIKNCDDFVHFQVIERKILIEMAKIVKKTKNMEIREKILGLLESWQEVFNGRNGRYPQFYNTYAELKKSGVKFPVNPSKNSDVMLALTGPVANQPQKGYKIPAKAIGRQDETKSEAAHFSLSDLYNIRNVMELLSKMLETVNPNDHKAIKDEVISHLVKECDIKQKQLVQLLNSTENDRLLFEALTLNDNLQALLSKYDALVSRSILPPEITYSPPLLSLPPLAPAVSCQIDGKEEEEDDEFSALAKRNYVHKSTGVQEVFHKTNEQIASIPENALSLLESRAPDISSNKEQDLIDLYSLTLPPSPQKPQSSFPSSCQNQNPFSDSINWEHYFNYQQPLMPSEAKSSYNSYVVPWAQPAVAHSPRHSSNDLSPSCSAAQGSSNPFLSTAYFQHPAFKPIRGLQKLSSFGSK